ncbi:hypothetical protein [Roseomonas sp. AR75]|uniref:hypothetical protein n=1 Tax=Roseomonas sp. AR75 TaxID=2562311 RepID=UPI0010C0F09B|nr:hypothetical protein [Roseomonas sp. AR75]
MIKRVLPVMLLALAGCAADDGLPPLTGGSDERPAWLLEQPPQYERYPVPDALRDTLALRSGQPGGAVQAARRGGVS